MSLDNLPTIKIFIALTSMSLCAMQRPTGFISIAESIQQGAHVTYTLSENGFDQWVLALDSAFVLGQGAIITQAGYVLSDAQTYRQDQHGLVNGRLDVSLMKQEFFDGILAVISCPGQQCYYHWFLQVLPRLQVLAESGLWYDKIYLHADNVKYPWQYETLYAVMDYLGIARDRVCWVSEDTIIQAKTLLVPSIAWNPAKLPLEVTGVFSWYKELFHRVFIKPTDKQLPSRIFISRSKAQYRRIANEPYLEQLLRAKGFKTVYLEDISIYDQAALFAHAEIIVGPHGAGWSNLIFCQPGTQVIEIDHGIRGPDQRSFYKNMAQHLGCIYTPFYVDYLENDDNSEISTAPINQDMLIDITLFEQVLKKII